MAISLTSRSSMNSSGIWLGPSDRALAGSEWTSMNNAVHAGGHGRAGQHRSEFAIAAGGAAESAGALHRVGGIENHGQAFLAHPVERAHVGDEVVVAEGGAALGDEEALAAEGAQFCRRC